MKNVLQDGHNFVFDSIMKLGDKEEEELFNEAMKEHEADERERIADEVIAQRNFFKGSSSSKGNIPNGYNTEGTPSHD